MVHPVRIASLPLLIVSLLFIGLLAPSLDASAPNASSNTIEVFPGTRAIRKALKQAAPGDILNIHAGTYAERVVIKRPNLTLQSAGDGEVIIDAGCNSVATIDVNAEGVLLRGLTVRGGTFFAINLEHIASGTIKKNKVINTCDGAEYGINVFDGGSVKVLKNQGEGWDDAVVYIGGIHATPNGALVVKNNTTHHSVRGIIIEDSSGVDIRVLNNNAHDNTLLGILIHNADNILIRGNTVTGNDDIGLYLDGTSDDDTVINNTFSGNGTDISNDGSDNCFEGNTFTTSQGPINPCS
jgi:nitrous oxidase accessory protein